jgi:sulfite reductase (ferredoxin)
MSFYSLPPSLRGEIGEFEEQIRQFRAGQLEPAAFKARRVPFGIYEQRKDHTFMVRVRCPAGALTPRQFRTIAELSQAHGAEQLHITTRQELQLHDVALEDVPAILWRLFDAGLSTRGGGGNTVRNITASASAGVATDEPFDASPYVFALTSRLIAEGDSWLLPRKYKIAFSNTVQDTARATLNDLGFIAVERNGVRGFAVYVAGGQGGKPQIGHLLHEFVPDTQVYFIAEAIKRLFHKHGNRKNRHAARLRFLWNNLGEKQFVELYEQEREQLRRAQAEPLKLAPLQQAASPERQEASRAASADFEKWRRRFVVEQKQSGLFTVLVPVLLGNLSNAGALVLADFLIPLGDDVLRATIEQNLQLRNVPEGLLAAAYEVIRGITPLASEPRILGSAVACTGASTCKLGVCLPRGALSATVRRLQASGLDLDRLADVRINLSGCPNSCGAHLTADLGFFGRVGRAGQTSYPAYEVVAGARLGHGTARLAEPLGAIAARDLPAFVVDALGRFLAQADAESFSEYFAGPGKQELVKLCQKYKDVPAFEDDKDYYFDWGATEVFSLAGRGMAQCSAGLFDLIEVDLKRLKELRQQRDAAPSQSSSDGDIYETALLSARMLLITRGVEAQSEREVFALFRRHFIDAGLVPAQYAPLLDGASANDANELRRRADEAFGLAAFMEDLYAKMDNSLRFPGETVAAPSIATTSVPPGAAPAETRDLRGVLCPMNFVKTKLALASLAAGQRLEVLLDDGPAVQNVPRSVVEEGHRIVDQRKHGGHWTVVIEKR